MRRMVHRCSVIPLILLLTLVIAQCSDNTLAPFEPEINSVTDSFQLQATNVMNRTATLDYAWENTGTRATVDHSTTTTAGSARVVILDDGDVGVYDEALVPSLSDTTAVGTAGNWTIRLILSSYSGTLNFRVQKD